jgi:hypothetical protein
MVFMVVLMGVSRGIALCQQHSKYRCGIRGWCAGEFDLRKEPKSKTIEWLFLVEVGMRQGVGSLNDRTITS